MKPKKPIPIIFDIRKDIHNQNDKDIIFYTFNKCGLYAFESKNNPGVFQIVFVNQRYEPSIYINIITIIRGEESVNEYYEINIKSQNDFDKLNSLFNIYYVDDNFIEWAVWGKQIPIKFGEYEPGNYIPKDMELHVADYNSKYISSHDFAHGYPYKVTNKITSKQFIGTFNENGGSNDTLYFATIVDECKIIRIEDIDKGIYQIKDIHDNEIPSSELTPIICRNPFADYYIDEDRDCRVIKAPVILLDKKRNIKITILYYIASNYIIFNSENLYDDTKFFEISASDLRRNYKVYLAHEDALNKLFHVSGVFSNDLFKLDENDLCIERWMY